MKFNEWFQPGRQANACYAVTDRRAISWVPEPKGDAIRVRTLPRGNIGEVTRVERPDGSGSLEFSLTEGSHYYAFCHYGFRHIPEVRRVEQIIRNTLMTTDRTS
jgi:hypothetical protein